ncbi:hypothetical protein FB391_2866 [Microbacterium kyungheense]|uniref:Uncharacterized protein n=1 Tax=Microbacterium kyungheense TaxID=1263636 RepID=A0A543ERX7_9MICO|nr:hypothetical protein FB391_2866 [Microbacterium kyungheense]
MAATVLLCGCAPVRIVGPAEAATPTPAATTGTAGWRSSSELPDVVTFEHGDGLRSGSWHVGWNHAGLWGGDYTYVLSAGPQDDGLWEYTQNATGCDIVLVQSRNADGTDDLAATDAALAESSEVDAAAFDDLVFETTATITGTPARLLFHAVAGKRAGASEHAQVVSTRVLTTVGTELSLQIECPEGSDAIAAGNLLLDDLTVDVRRSGEPLDFEATATLVPDESVWQDSALVSGGGWTLTTPDDGGSWGYTSADGDCTADFQQSRLDESQRGAGDDRVATDRLMAWYYSWSESDVSSDAGEQTLGFGPAGNRILAARTVEAVDDSGRNGILAARAFRQSDLGFLIDVWCTEGDPADSLEEILGNASVVPPGW